MQTKLMAPLFPALPHFVRGLHRAGSKQCSYRRTAALCADLRVEMLPIRNKKKYNFIFKALLYVSAENAQFVALRFAHAYQVVLLQRLEEFQEAIQSADAAINDSDACMAVARCEKP